MKYIKDEKGSALLLVLMFSVMLGMFFMMFAAKSINHAKQEQIVDKSHLSFVAAEMGVDYYSGKISNEYYDKTLKLKAEADSMLSKKNYKGEYIYSPEQVQNVIKTEFEKFFNQYSLNYFQGPMSTYDSSDYYFNLINISTNIDRLDSDGVVEVKGVINGYNSLDNKTKEITFIQTYVMPNILNDSVSIDNETKNPMFKENVMREILETTCEMKKIRGKNVIEQNCNINIVDSFNSNNNIVMTNSNVYVSDEVTAKNNFEMKDSTVYVNGNFRVGHGNGNGSKPKITDSKVCVTGYLLKNDNNPVLANLDEDFILRNSSIYAKNSVSAEIWNDNCTLFQYVERKKTQLDWEKPKMTVEY